MTIIEREYIIQCEGDKNFVINESLLNVREQLINLKGVQREAREEILDVHKKLDSKKSVMLWSCMNETLHRAGLNHLRNVERSNSCRPNLA